MKVKKKKIRLLNLLPEARLSFLVVSDRGLNPSIKKVN